MRSRATLLVAALVWPVIGCGEATMDAVGLLPGHLSVGLVAHWRLDEGGGTVANDASGNGHDGQLTGGSWISDARFGGGVRFGEGDTIAVSGFPPATPNWSVSVWIRLSSEQLAADSGTWTTILSTENIGSGGWEINIDRQLPQPRFVFSYWAPPFSDYIGTECGCVGTGAWLHLAAVVDVNANRMTLYRDGVVADQVGRPSDIPPGDSTLHFAHWNMAGRLLVGDLDDIAIWQRALSAEEVTALTSRSP